MADLSQPSINAGARRFLARWDRRFHSLQSRVARFSLAIVSVTVALGLSLALQYYQFRGVEVPVLTLAIKDRANHRDEEVIKPDRLIRADRLKE